MTDILEYTEHENIQEQDILQDGTVEQQTAEQQEDFTESKDPESISVYESENVSPTVSDELYAEILTELRTGNEILGRIYALNIFILAIMFSLLMYLIIKNNITKFF